MADIPGLIEGAAGGAGLGIRFLKHLQRTRVLLHLVDIAPVDPNADPVRDAHSIVGELGKFSEDLLAKPRWLVLNKSDLMPPDEARARAIEIAQGLGYRGPAFLISGATHAGTSELCEAVMRFLETAETRVQGNLVLPLEPVRASKPPKRAKRAPKKTARRAAPARSPRGSKGKAKFKAKAKAKAKTKAKPSARITPKKSSRKPAKSAKRKQKTRR